MFLHLLEDSPHVEPSFCMSNNAIPDREAAVEACVVFSGVSCMGPECIGLNAKPDERPMQCCFN